MIDQFGRIGGSVWCDNDGNNIMDTGEGLEDIRVKLFDAAGLISSTVTTNAGNYLFENLRAGTYRIVASGAPIACSEIASEPDSTVDQTTTVDLALGESNLNINFVYRPMLASITDVIWVDVNGDGVRDVDEAGLPGVAVQLFDTSNNLLQNVISDAIGEYMLADIEPLQQYYLSFTLPSGWEISGVGASDLATPLDQVSGQTGIFDVVPGTAFVNFAVAVAQIEAETSTIYLPYTAR